MVEKTPQQAAHSVASTVNQIRNSDREGAKNTINNIKQRLAMLNATDVLTEAALALAGKTPSNPVARQQAKQPLREIVNDVFDDAAIRTAQDMYYNNSPSNHFVENAPSARSQMRPVLRGEWSVTQNSKVTSSGKEQIRYSVGSKRAILPDQFRHKIVAETVAAALEQTGGNLSDPRIEKIRRLCEEENSLVTEITNQKRLVESTDPGNQKRMGAHQSRLEQAKIRLKDIRRALGVN
jgi:hypothetical protein